jgi:hypothetical protein
MSENEKPRILFDLEGQIRKVFLGMKPADQLGLDETGVTSHGETSKTPTPEPARVAAPKVERTAADQQTGSEPRPTLNTQALRPPNSPTAMTRNPERFLQ